MNCVAVKEAKNNFTQLLHLVEKGQSIQISRHGKVVAVLTSIESYKETNLSSSFAKSLEEWRLKSSQILSQNEFSNSQIDEIFKSDRKIESSSRANELSEISKEWDSK